VRRTSSDTCRHNDHLLVLLLVLLLPALLAADCAGVTVVEPPKVDACTSLSRGFDLMADRRVDQAHSHFDDAVRHARAWVVVSPEDNDATALLAGAEFVDRFANGSYEQIYNFVGRETLRVINSICS
jgi:hypothetical protein